MPTSCCAYNCNERFTPGGSISFHRFPTKNEMLFRAWCIALRRKDFHPTWASRVCSKHFTPDSFQSNCIGYRALKLNAVPTIFDFSKKKYKTNPLKKSLKTTKSYNSTPRTIKTVDFQSDESADIDSEIYSFEEKPNVVNIKLKSTPRCIKTMDSQSDDSADTGSGMYSFEEKLNIIKLKSTPRRIKTVDSQSDESTDTASERYSFEKKSNGVEIIKLKRETFDEERGMECLEEQFETFNNTTKDETTVDKLVRIDSLPSDQYYNMQNENEILRQTIDHLSKKIERFKCLTNVLQSNELISEEAAEVLRCTINM